MINCNFVISGFYAGHSGKVVDCPNSHKCQVGDASDHRLKMRKL